MTYLDVALALPLLYGVYRGFTKGLILSVASLLALLLGIFAAIKFSSYFGGYIDNWFQPDPKHLKVLSFALTVLRVVIIVRLIGWGLDKLVKAVALGFVNRLLGVVFNVMTWAFLLSVLISIADSSEYTKNIINEKHKDESVLYRPLSKVAPLVFPYLNFDMMKEKINDSATQPPEEKTI